VLIECNNSIKKLLTAMRFLNRSFINSVKTSKFD